MWYVGVDPGIHGAVAFLSTGGGGDLQIIDMPLKPPGQGTTRREIDPIKLFETFENFVLLNGSIKLALVETPHSMPNDGHVGAFKFGKTCGLIEGVIAATKTQMIGVVPAVWKVRMGLTNKKEDSLTMAREIFGPFNHRYFERKKDNDRAEAALLAHYAVKTFGGK